MMMLKFLEVSSVTCSGLLKTSGIFCLETGESICVRQGQLYTDTISGDSFQSCFMSVMSSAVCNKSSSTSFNIAGHNVAKSTDHSSQTKTNPLTTSVLPHNYLDTSFNELVWKRTGVT
jgi:hypothetical protein